MIVTKTKVLDMTVYGLTVDVGHQQVTNNKLHHVMVLDRSGSMTYHLDELVDNVLECLKLIKADDLVTIIWYSGPGQWNILAKGSKVTDELIRLVDGLRDSLGTTCFSEPLAQARLSAIDYQPVVDATWLTIFTDGQPVVPWSYEQEMSRAIREVGAGDFLACFAIGYGSHYNRDFLVNLSGHTEHGEFFHAQNIRDYQILFARGVQTITNVSGKIVEVVSVEGDILYLGGDTLQLHPETIKVHADRHFNTFYLINPSDVEVDGKRVAIDTWKPMPLEERENFLFAYAYSLYRDGYRARAQEILLETRSRWFIEQAMSVFTNEEVGVFLQKLREAVFEVFDTHQVRFPTGAIPQGMLPKRDAFCVLDLLKYLGEQENCWYVHKGKLKTEKYHRISKKRVSSFNAFEFDDDDEGIAEFSSLVYNENAANISIRVYRKGKVNLNPIRAKQVGLPQQINCARINNYNIIQDGKLNMKEMEVIVPYEVYKRLAFDDNIQGLITKAEFLPDNNRARMLLRLDVLPVINAVYAQSPNLDFLAETVYQLNILKARQKALKWVLDHPIVNQEGKEVTLSAYTPEQEQVLKEHGLSPKLVYSDIAPETIEEGDSYETRYMAFKLEKTTLPKVDDLIKKTFVSSSATPFQMEMHEQIIAFYPDIDSSGNLSEAGARSANHLVEETKKYLRQESHKLSTIRIAKVLTNDWFSGLTLNEKGGVYESKYGKLTITSERKTIKL